MILTNSCAVKKQEIKTVTNVAKKPILLNIDESILEGCGNYYFDGKDKATYEDVKKTVRIQREILDFCNKKLKTIREKYRNARKK